MVSYLERGANGLHIVHLMPLPSRHLLLHENPEWFCLSGSSLARFPGKRLINSCIVVVVVAYHFIV